MTHRKLRIIRGIWSIALCLISIIVDAFVLLALPEYLHSHGIMRATGIFLLVVSAATMFFMLGDLIFNDPEKDAENMFYNLVYLLVTYEAISFLYYLLLRWFGYRHFRAYFDNMSTIVIIQGIALIVLCCLIHNVKCRRLLFENKSWRNPSDNDFTKETAKIGIVFSLIVVATVSVTESVNRAMFSPSGTSNGYGYVNLGLKSGTMWADHNLLSTSRETTGIKTSWGKSLFTADKSLREFEWHYGNMALDEDIDIAHELMDGQWSMPSKGQWRELKDVCKSFPSYYNGIYGVTFVGKNRFKRIFIPAPESGLYSDTDYWTTTPDEEYVYGIERDYDVWTWDSDAGDENQDEAEEETTVSGSQDESNGVAAEEDTEPMPPIATLIHISTIERLPWGLVHEELDSTFRKCYIRPVLATIK